MHSRFVTLSAILGLLASIAFSIIGYKIQGFPLGHYFAILIFALTLILLLFYFEFSLLVVGLRQLIGPNSYKFRSLKQILVECKGRRVVLYLNSFRLLVDLAESSALAGVPLGLIDVYVSPVTGDADVVTQNALDQVNGRFHSVSLTSARVHFNLLVAPTDGEKNLVFLAPSHSFEFSDSWISDPGSQGHSSIMDILNDEIKRTSIPIRRLKAVGWLLQQYAARSEFLRECGENLAAGRINSTSPEEIYAQQIALSRGAKSILALDMTEVSEWADSKGLGKCLEENILSGCSSDADIRRIFICRSRAFMAETESYRRAIANVIRAHLDNGLGAGLVYQEDIKNPSVIHDVVIYDKYVVWVETLPTNRFSGEGYFSTDEVLIAHHCATFERLWGGEFTRSPQEEALAFLRDCPDEQA